MFNGRYGNLPAVQAAALSLQDIAANTSWDDINRKDYDSNRLMMMIEGLQMVIYRNGGKQPVTWLPFLYKTEPIEGKFEVVDQPKRLSYREQRDPG